MVGVERFGSSTDAYDADGNTVGSGTNTGANGYMYDFENRLIQQAGISIVYDGDSNAPRIFVLERIVMEYEHLFFEQMVKSEERFFLLFSIQ